MDLSALHFVRPWWFAALLPLAGLLWLLARERVSGKNWERVCDAQLLPFMLLGRTADVGKRGFLFLTGLAGVLGVVALSGPAWERLPQPVLRDQSALVIVFDLSLSMSSVDVKPNRLLRARFKINDLLERRAHGQTGLVVYARDAFTVVPLTDDTEAIDLYLQALDPDLMPRQGSRPDLGLEEAGALLQKVEAETGDVLLVGDYADARTLTQARRLNDKGYKVSVLGVGTEEGGPIAASKKFLTHEGEVVVPKLDQEALEEVARVGGGEYAGFDPFAAADVETLTRWFDSHVSAVQDRKESEARADVWREEGPWLVLALLPIAALAFRRGLLVVAAVAAITALAGMQAGPAHALDWGGLWLRPDQQGVRALDEGDAARAAELFENEEWKATAQYRSGDYNAAVETLDQLDGAVNWYNKGNALVGAGKLQEAVEAYRRALEINPAMEDATYNLGVVQQVLQQMQQQQMQQQQGEEGDEEGQQAQAQQAQASEDESGEPRQGENDENGEQGDEKKPQQSNEGDEESEEGKDGEEEGEENGDEDDVAGSSSPLETLTEKDQAIEQWLRGVPDDPGRLLKRKLKHLSRKKKAPDKGAGDSPW